MIGNLGDSVTLQSVLPSGGSDVSETVVQLLIQLAVILFAAKVAGELTARFLKLSHHFYLGFRATKLRGASSRDTPSLQD